MYSVEAQAEAPVGVADLGGVQSVTQKDVELVVVPPAQRLHEVDLKQTLSTA